LAAIKHPLATACKGSAACLTSLITNGKPFSSSFLANSSMYPFAYDVPPATTTVNGSLNFGKSLWSVNAALNCLVV
jgi:hypothetical protein